MPTDQDRAKFLSGKSEAIRQARRSISRQLMLLQEIASGEGKSPASLQNPEFYAADALVAVGNLINPMLVNLAEMRWPCAADFVWDTGFNLAAAIKWLALHQPDLLKPKARKSTYLPSLRATPKNFTDDFENIAKAIELAKDTEIKSAANAKYRLDSYAMNYAEQLVRAAIQKRDYLIQLAPAWDAGFGRTHRSKKQFLLNLPTVKPADIILLELPAFHQGTARVWWVKYFRPLLDLPETLESIKGTPLYKNLKHAAKKDTERHLTDDLKKACEPKILKSLAPVLDDSKSAA